MRIALGMLAAAGAAAGAAVAILGAPVASAQPNCVDTSVGVTQCQSPGNTEINATPPVTEEPFIMPYWDGVYSGGGYEVPMDEGDLGR